MIDELWQRAWVVADQIDETIGAWISCESQALRSADAERLIELGVVMIDTTSPVMDIVYTLRTVLGAEVSVIVQAREMALRSPALQRWLAHENIVTYEAACEYATEPLFSTEVDDDGDLYLRRTRLGTSIQEWLVSDPLLVTDS